MSIFSRIQKLIESNLNEILDKVEDPETQVNQVIRDLEQGLIDLRQNLASAMAAHKVSEFHLREILSEAKEWKDNAILALQNKDEALARKALEKKLYYQSRQTRSEDQIEQDLVIVERLRRDMSLLENKVSEARSKRETLVIKKESSQQRSEILNTQEGIVQKVSQAQDLIDRVGSLGQFEKDVIHQEAHAQAREELLAAQAHADFETKMKQMKKEQTIDEELALLKAELEDGE